MDLYRLESLQEVAGIGFVDYIDSELNVVVEWPQIARDLFPDDTLTISFTHSGEEKRVVDILRRRGELYTEEGNENQV